MPVAEDADLGLELAEARHLGSRHGAGGGDVGALDGRRRIDARDGIALDQRIGLHPREVELHHRAGFLRGVDMRAGLGGDVGCVVRVVAVAVADEDRFGLEVDHVLDHEVGAPRRDLEPRGEAVEQHDPSLDRGRVGRVGQPGEDHLVAHDPAAARVDVLDAEELLPRRDQLGTGAPAAVIVIVVVRVGRCDRDASQDCAKSQSHGAPPPSSIAIAGTAAISGWF